MKSVSTILGPIALTSTARAPDVARWRSAYAGAIDTTAAAIADGTAPTTLEAALASQLSRDLAAVASLVGAAGPVTRPGWLASLAWLRGVRDALPRWVSALPRPTATELRSLVMGGLLTAAAKNRAVRSSAIERAKEAARAAPAAPAAPSSSNMGAIVAGVVGGFVVGGPVGAAVGGAVGFAVSRSS